MIHNSTCSPPGASIYSIMANSPRSSLFVLRSIHAILPQIPIRSPEPTLKPLNERYISARHANMGNTSSSNRNGDRERGRKDKELRRQGKKAKREEPQGITNALPLTIGCTYCLGFGKTTVCPVAARNNGSKLMARNHSCATKNDIIPRSDPDDPWSYTLQFNVDLCWSNEEKRQAIRKVIDDGEEFQGATYIDFGLLVQQCDRYGILYNEPLKPRTETSGGSSSHRR
ncbi:hypothetical protein B0T17DRAFT_380963 [Bombardia bombarda]|uniref:Uncharacterized protein n=1 Tax=Bombardia bombarda TaxID=252184 RepID=A0AA40BVK0_9PEZI|nr:hypothetical protein B0T17DRAFT_380963 [Bombardia bombarda]